MVSVNMDRRHVMKVLGAIGASSLAGCSSDGGSGNGGSGNGNGNGGSGNGNGNGDGDNEAEEENFGEGETELRFAGWGSGAEDEAVSEGLQNFADQTEDVSVNYQNIPWENYNERLQTQFGGGEEPDAFYTNFEFHTQFVNEDLLVNLSEQFDDEFIDGFDSSVIDEYRMPDGNLYMTPFAYTPVTVNYNKDLFSQAGYDEFPETWSEFEEALVAISEETDVDYPYVEEATGNQAAFIWRPWMYGNGGQIMTDDNSESVVASDEAVEALSFFSDLREQELIGSFNQIGAEDDEFALVDEQVAMHTGNAVSAANIRSDNPDFYEEKFGIAQPPRPDDGEFGNEISGAGYAVSANSNSIDTATDLVAYMLETGITPYLEAGVALSVRESHMEEIDLYNEDERYQTMLEMTEVPNIKSPNWGPHSSEIGNVLHPQVEGVMAGEVEAREALETAQSQINNDILE